MRIVLKYISFPVGKVCVGVFIDTRNKHDILIRFWFSRNSHDECCIIIFLRQTTELRSGFSLMRHESFNGIRAQSEDLSFVSPIQKVTYHIYNVDQCVRPMQVNDEACRPWWQKMNYVLYKRSITCVMQSIVFPIQSNISPWDVNRTSIS